MGINPTIRQVVVDFICLVIVFVVLPLIPERIVPFPKLGFYCDDDSIKYPNKDSTLSRTLVGGVGYILPIVTMIVVELVRWRDRTGKNANNGINRLEHRSSSVILGKIRFPSVVVEIIHLVAIFLFGAACSQLTTDFGKYSIGRLRPHFLAVCNVTLSDVCDENDPHKYITDYTCNNSNEHQVRDSRLSFPSGHASFSMYTMLYLVLYLQRRMNWSGSYFIRPTYQIALLMLTWYTGLSRVTDYKHHWSDVLSGFLIGAVAASLTALYVSTLFKPARYAGKVLLPQNHNDIGLDQRSTNYSDPSTN